MNLRFPRKLPLPNLAASDNLVRLDYFTAETDASPRFARGGVTCHKTRSNRESNQPISFTKAP